MINYGIAGGVIRISFLYLKEVHLVFIQNTYMCVNSDTIHKGRPIKRKFVKNADVLME